MSKIAQIVIRESEIDNYKEKNLLENYIPVTFLEIQGRENDPITGDNFVEFTINGSDTLQLGPSGIYEIDLTNAQGYIQSLVFIKIEGKMTSNYEKDPIAVIINILHEGVEI